MVISSTYYWKDKSVLIVEDDESSSFLLGEILKNTGVSLNFASTGNEAIEFIREHPATDLVLMDIHLPDKDGFTATREIKQINQRIFVITQSAYVLNVRLNPMATDEADDFLSKPINPGLLLLKIDSFLGDQ